MGDTFFNSVTTVALMIGIVAIVALVVSRKAQTPAVIQSLASGYGNDLAVAESPVTGSAVTPNLNYPGQSSYGYGLSGFGPANNFPNF